MPRQIPVPDEVSKPLWDAANQRKLIVQKCASCNRLQYPPSKTCQECGSADNLGWTETSGRGKIVSYSIIRDGYLRTWLSDMPYNVAVIALEEDPTIRFFSTLPGTPVGNVPVGGKVELTFVEAGPTQLIHEWKVVG